MRLFNSQKLKIFAAIAVSTSVFLLSACSNDLGVYNEESEKKYFQELLNAPVKEVVALKVEDSEKERKDIENVAHEFYRSLLSYNNSDYETAYYSEPSEVDSDHKYNVATLISEVNIGESLRADKNESMEDKLTKLDEYELARLINFSQKYVSDKVDINYDSLTPVQKAYAGIMLGNISIYNSNNFYKLDKDKVMSDIDEDKVFYRDRDVIIPRNAVDFTSSEIAEEELFNIPLRLIKTKESGYTVDFYTYAKMLEKFSGSLDELKVLYEKQSPRLVDEVMKENSK